MKKKGFTIIEAVVTIATLAIVFYLATPLIRSFTKVTGRVQTQKSIDSEFSVIKELIQEKIVSAKRTSKDTGYSGGDSTDFHDDLKYASIYNKFYNDADQLFASSNRTADGDLGNVLVLEIPFDDSGSDSSQFEILAFTDDALKYKIIVPDDDSFGNFETLMDSVEVYSGPDSPTATADIEDQLNSSSFKLNKGIVIYHINLNIGDSEGKFNDSFRSSASSRIDIDL